LTFLGVNTNCQKTSILDRKLLQMNCIYSPNKQEITALLWTFTNGFFKGNQSSSFSLVHIMGNEPLPSKTSAPWVCKYYQLHLVSEGRGKLCISSMLSCQASLLDIVGSATA